MTQLVLDHVSRSFGEVRAVDDLSLVVEAGQRVAIVGPSASGKTTVLRLIAGFEVPDAGTVSIDGALMSGGGVFVPPHRRRVGYVAQEGALFPHLTVGQNVAFGLARGRDRAATVAEMLQLVALDPGIRDRRPDQLSGGQQQRVALARSLAVRPHLLLLDEPFSALDAETRVETRESIARILEASTVTTVLVTHDPEDAHALAHQVAVMRAGRLVAIGAPDEVYRGDTDPR